MPTDTELAWLGGIIDGEGSVIIFSHTEKNGSRKICPSVSIVNTDLGIINKARKILEELGLSFVLQDRSRYKQKKHYKDQYALISRNQKYITTLLLHITPYLFSNKRQAAELVRDYCVQRQNKVERIPNKGTTPYDEKDWEYLENYQKKFRSPETIREASLSKKH